MREALDALAEDDREVLTLTYWEGLTSEQAAVVLGVRPATARKRLARGRRRVAVVLAVQAGGEGHDRRRLPDPANAIL